MKSFFRNVITKTSLLSHVSMWVVSTENIPKSSITTIILYCVIIAVPCIVLLPKHLLLSPANGIFWGKKKTIWHKQKCPAAWLIAEIVHNGTRFHEQFAENTEILVKCTEGVYWSRAYTPLFSTIFCIVQDNRTRLFWKMFIFLLDFLVFVLQKIAKLTKIKFFFTIK